MSRNEKNLLYKGEDTLTKAPNVSAKDVSELQKAEDEAIERMQANAPKKGPLTPSSFSSDTYVSSFHTKLAQVRLNSI